MNLPSETITRKKTRIRGKMRFECSDIDNYDYLIIESVVEESEEIIDARFSTKILEERQIGVKTEKQQKYKLQEISLEELKEKRMDESTPGFILKVPGRFFYAKVKKSLRLVSYHNQLGAHMCAIPNGECKRLSSAPDEYGGCEKVRRKSIGIEDFSFIHSGYETINTKQDCLVVLKCDHYEPVKDVSEIIARKSQVFLESFSEIF